MVGPRFISGIYNEARFNVPKHYVQDLIAYGLPRQGKTVFILTWIEKAFEYCHHKIFDVWDAQRGENGVYGLPSRFKKWKKPIIDKFGNEFKAEGLPCTLFFPMSKKLPKEIPAPSKVFTIPVNSLELDDITSLVGGDISKNEITVFNLLKQQYFHKDMTVPELKKLIRDLPHMKLYSKEGYQIPPPSKFGINTIFRAIDQLGEEKILSSASCPTAIDIYEEYKKREITSFVMTHCDNWLAMWVAQWLVRNIYYTLKRYYYWYLSEINFKISSSVGITSPGSCKIFKAL